MSTLGIIPARGGSKGVKDKNILPFAGRPLIAYTIDAALESDCLDKVAVSTDSERIADVVRKHYTDVIDIVMRPAEFAQDDSPIEESFHHALDYLKDRMNFATDILVWMQPNVPFREKGLVDTVVRKLIEGNADSCVTCFEADQIPEVMKIITPAGKLEPLYRDIDGIRRQEFPKRYLLDGSVVAIKAKNLSATKHLRKAHVYLGEQVLPVIQSQKMYSLEIDEMDDIPLIQYFFERYFDSHPTPKVPRS